MQDGQRALRAIGPHQEVDVVVARDDDAAQRGVRPGSDTGHRSLGVCGLLTERLENESAVHVDLAEVPGLSGRSCGFGHAMFVKRSHGQGGSEATFKAATSSAG